MNKIAQIFETMDYGPAPESAQPAVDWLKAHGQKFGHFINGAWTKPGKLFASDNPATGKKLADITDGTSADVDRAVKAARAAFPAWSALSGYERGKHLYAIARLIQKHSRLFAVLESMDNGKPIRESRDIDVPLVARHFYYHAGLAQLLGSELPGHAPLGVCGAIIPWNFPLLMLAWKVAPALAAGNTVVLKPAEYTPLTALLFADLTREAWLGEYRFYVDERVIVPRSYIAELLGVRLRPWLAPRRSARWAPSSSSGCAPPCERAFGRNTAAGQVQTCSAACV